MSKVVKAVLWTNGMVMAFDQAGQQVPEYQGRGHKIIPLLRRDFPDLLIIGGDWATDVRPIRRCEMCGEAVSGRADKVYCSNKCRVKAWRCK